jgi:glycosyltransferase involved in cell wall biosynthesis
MQGNNWRCVLAGSGPAEGQLRTLVATLGLQEQVIFTGFIPHTEAPPLLSMFDVLVLPSETRRNWKEQFGRVIIEANACGTAVIGTNSGEIANVLRKTGGGIVVPEANVPALSDAILKLANDPELVLELSRTGAAAVATLYDQSLLASQFASTVGAAAMKGGK